MPQSPPDSPVPDALAIAMVQMASSPDPAENLECAAAFLDECADREADLAVFPENVVCLGRGRTVREAARSEAEWHATLGPLAAERNLATVFGGVPVQHADGVRNSSLVYDRDGKVLARYDKMHLFRLNPDSPGGIDETRVYAHGDTPVAFDFRGWRLALTICYDIRFPELYRALVPFDLFLCTVAFTAMTGREHWELLVRTRSVENQAFGIAVGQCGTNTETGVAHFGHSLGTGPWGNVLADAGTEEGVTLVRVSKAEIDDVRRRLPAITNRRLP